jgi:hypothetical protein
VELSPSDDLELDSSNPDMWSPLAIGSTTAGAVVLTGVLLWFYLWRRRRRKKQSPKFIFTPASAPVVQPPALPVLSDPDLYGKPSLSGCYEDSPNKVEDLSDKHELHLPVQLKTDRQSHGDSSDEESEGEVSSDSASSDSDSQFDSNENKMREKTVEHRLSQPSNKQDISKTVLAKHGSVIHNRHHFIGRARFMSDESSAPSVVFDDASSSDTSSAPTVVFSDEDSSDINVDIEAQLQPK